MDGKVAVEAEPEIQIQSSFHCVCFVPTSTYELSTSISSNFQWYCQSRRNLHKQVLYVNRTVKNVLDAHLREMGTSSKTGGWANIININTLES